MAHCKSCDAPIVWCVNARGKWQPIDWDPVAGGNIRIMPNPIPNCRVEPDVQLFSDEDDGVRHFAHHMTCPHRDEWTTGNHKSEPVPPEHTNRYVHT